MPYVTKSLGANERLLMIGRFPWPYHVVAWAALLLLGLVAVGVIIFIAMQVHFATTESALTTRRVVYKKGLFTRQTMELGLTSIEQVELKQGFWGRVFGFGQIVISGSGDGHIVTHPLADPVRFRRLLTDARASNHALNIAPGDLERLAGAARGEAPAHPAGRLRAPRRPMPV